MARHVEHHPVLGQVIWARKPFHGRLGAYVAVRLRSGHLSVAIRHAGAVEWVAAERALSEREAALWARTGF